MYPTESRKPGPAKASILRKTPGPRGTSSVACTPGRLGSAGKLRQAAGSVAMTSYFIGDVGFRHIWLAAGGRRSAAVVGKSRQSLGVSRQEKKQNQDPSTAPSLASLVRAALGMTKF